MGSARSAAACAQSCSHCHAMNAGVPANVTGMSAGHIPMPVTDTAAEGLIREYLLLGLRFDRIEEGYVDSFTGDPALRHAVVDEAAPDPAALARQARRLHDDVDGSGLDPQRGDYLKAH